MGLRSDTTVRIAHHDAAFSQEARGSLVSKADLTGHGFEGLAGSVGGFRSMEEVFGCSRSLLWVARPAVHPVPSSADRLVCSHQLNHRRGKFRQGSR